MTEAVAETPKRSKIPLFFFAFFGVVLLANSIMIYIALSSWTGLETKNYYIKGVHYNEALKGASEQAERGWSSTVALRDVHGLSGRIVVHLVKPGDVPIVGADFKAEILRPTTTGFDQTIALSETAPGTYEGVVTFPMKGQWDIRQVVHHKDGSYQAIERIMVKP